MTLTLPSPHAHALPFSARVFILLAKDLLIHHCIPSSQRAQIAFGHDIVVVTWNLCEGEGTWQRPGRKRLAR